MGWRFSVAFLLQRILKIIAQRLRMPKVQKALQNNDHDISSFHDKEHLLLNKLKTDLHEVTVASQEKSSMLSSAKWCGGSHREQMKRQHQQEATTKIGAGHGSSGVGGLLLDIL
jgi:hypothetical protein